MGEDLRSDPVFERGNDTAPIGIILGVCREYELQIERKPHLKASDLDIAFLQDIEERYLDPGLQVREFVDSEDAAVGPRDHPEMDYPVVGV